MKILMDTDIGTDSDDAVCLAYLLVQQECELLGVTTLGPDAAIRGDVVRTLCSHLGQPDIPVASGADVPILSNRYWSGHQVNHQRILASPPRPRPSQPAAAIELMRSVIRSNPGEVTLLTLGPLTNVAMLALHDPECMPLLKAVVSMFGVYPNDPENPRCDCNTMLDPAAAHVVLSRELPQQMIVSEVSGIDMQLTEAEVDALFSSDTLLPVHRCCDAWMEKLGGPGGLYDPFTAACMLDPSFCSYEQGRLDVKFSDHDLARGFAFEGGQMSGWTSFSPDPSGPHRMAIVHDLTRYRQHLYDTFAKANH